MSDSPFGPALGLIEYSSIAAGIEAGDAMVKRAPLRIIRAGSIHPGRYVVLVAGEVADIEEAFDSAKRIGAADTTDELFLPDPHPDLLAAIAGARGEPTGEALGVIETSTISAAIRGADGGLKGAAVGLRDLFLGDDLGGKGYLLFSGPVNEVQAAVEIGVERAEPAVVAWRVIAQLHDEMDENLRAAGRFGPRVTGG